LISRSGKVSGLVRGMGRALWVAIRRGRQKERQNGVQRRASGS